MRSMGGRRRWWRGRRRMRKRVGQLANSLACGRRSSTRRRYPGVRRWRSTITPSALCCGWFILYVSRGTITKPRTIRALISTLFRFRPAQKPTFPSVIYDNAASLPRRCVIACTRACSASRRRFCISMSSRFKTRRGPFTLSEIIFRAKLSISLRPLNDCLNK